MRNYKKKGRRKQTQSQLKKSILKFLSKKPNKAYSPGTISSKIKGKNSRDAVFSAIANLISERKIIIDNKGRCSIHPLDQPTSGKIEILEGIVDLTASGGAYVIVSGQSRDTYIPKKYVNGALQGDTVEIEVRHQFRGRRSEGRITRIIKRKRISFIGIFQEYSKFGYVYVETPKMALDVKVLPDNFLGAESGDGVVVDIIDFGDGRHRDILGKVVTILPRDNRNDYEMSSILVNNGFDLAFPSEVIEQLERISEDIQESEIALRKDMRTVKTFTIDPVDAKDFDDAISFQELENEQFEIGVHIADVTHYVTTDTPMDKEAFKRSTSVYLVDRVCPMLPEKISNELCSLRPKEDKLAFSVLFTFSKNGKLSNTRIGKTIIHSDERFTYEQAQDVLEGQDHHLKRELIFLNNIAKKLHDKRFKEGSINFESGEVRFELDENKVPNRIVKKERKDAHKLIEEYMLLANQEVAKFIIEKSKAPEIPYVYRIHDLPDAEKLTDLALLASEFGIRLNFDTPNRIKESLNHLSSEDISSDIQMSLLIAFFSRT